MPIERVSQGFKDLSMSFKANPLNADLIAIKNETAIARSVRNLVLTIPGERFFNQNLGSDVYRSLFEDVSDFNANIIREQVEKTIKDYERRVELIKVIVDPLYDDNSFNITINYYIIGIDVPAQQLSFVLQPTR